MRKILSRIRNRLGDKLLAPASRTRLSTGIYYLIFNSRFLREQHAVLAGRLKYQRNLKRPDGTMALLRRNTHRLEKGLLMRPRRVPFATDYIEETLDAFITARAQDHYDRREIQWASDVLDEYFTVNADVARLQPLEQRFRGVSGEECRSPSPLVPYQRDLTRNPQASYDALLELAIRRRSVRWFLPKKVPRELIDRAIVLGTLAPSACNRQPFEYRIVDDPELLEKIVEIPFGLRGYGHNVPCIAVVIGNQSNFFDERDRHLIYIDSSLATMGVVLALETMGLSSCCINWPDIEEKERAMAKLLGLEPEQRPIMLVAIGYPDPDGMVANSPKKEIDRVRKFNLE